MKGRFTAIYLMWRLRLWRFLHPARHRWMPIDLWWKLEPQIRLVLMTSPQWTQLNFRIRLDGAGVGINSTSFDYTLGEDPTLDLDTTYRCRFTVEETATASPAVNQSFALYYQVNGGGYNPVTTSSTNVRAVTPAGFTDGDATTDVLAGSARTFIAGEGCTDGTTANVLSMSNSHTELEFSFQLRSADLSGGETVNIRVELADGTDLNVYTDTPVITVAAPPVTLDGVAPVVASASGSLTVTGYRALDGVAPAAIGLAADLSVTSPSPDSLLLFFQQLIGV